MTRAKREQKIDDLSLLEEQTAKLVIGKEKSYLPLILGIPDSRDEISKLIAHKDRVSQFFMTAESWDAINHAYPIIASFIEPNEYNVLIKEAKYSSINGIYNKLNDIYTKSGRENRFIGLAALVDILPSIYINEPVSRQRLYCAIRVQRGERLGTMRNLLVGHLTFLFDKIFRDKSLLKNENAYMSFHYNNNSNAAIENVICDVLYNFFSCEGNGRYSFPNEAKERLSAEGFNFFFKSLSEAIEANIFEIREKERFFSAKSTILENEEYKSIISFFEEINKLQDANKEDLSEVKKIEFVNNFISNNYFKINNSNDKKIKKEAKNDYFKEVQAKVLPKISENIDAISLKKSRKANINSYKKILLYLSAHLYKNILNFTESRVKSLKREYNIFIGYDIQYENQADSPEKEKIKKKVNTLDLKISRLKQLERIIRNYLEVGDKFKELNKLHNFDMFIDETLNLSSNKENPNMKLLNYLQSIEDAFYQFKQVNKKDITSCVNIISIYKEALIKFPIFPCKDELSKTKINNKINPLENRNEVQKISLSLNFFSLKKHNEVREDKQQPMSARSYGEKCSVNNRVLERNKSFCSDKANQVAFKFTQESLDNALDNIRKKKIDSIYFDKKITLKEGGFFQPGKDIIPDGYFSDTNIRKQNITISPSTRME